MTFKKEDIVIVKQSDNVVVVNGGNKVRKRDLKVVFN